jgi:RNA recognition motif-containing protein
MKKLFVGSLPPTTSEEAVRNMFSEFGTVRSIQLVKDMFSGHCKGFGFLEMEGHEARAAIAGLDGKSFEGNILKVKFEQQRGKQHRGRRR